MAQHEFRQIYPDTGWVEHDPFDILTSQMSSAVEVLSKAQVRPRDVAALGITNQRETTLVWERESGKPVYNAIVWQDRRGAALYIISPTKALLINLSSSNPVIQELLH